MNTDKEISWLDGTPLGIRIYSIRSLSTQFHDDLIEIIMCLRGSVDYYCAYEKYKLNEGDFISVDRDVYFLGNGRDCICASVFIDFKYLAERYPDLRESMFACDGRSSQPLRKSHIELQSLLLGLMCCLMEDGDKEQQENEIKMVADKIIKCMVDNFDILYNRVPKEEFNDKYVERYHRMNIYMYEHMEDNITLRELAEEFHLTESYVSEFIRKSGLNFKKIMAYIKANKSEKLLLTTEYSIADIAERCGFSDVKLYYAAFREWYHCTPKQFRERYKYGTRNDVALMNIKDVETEIMKISMLNHKRRVFI